MPGFDGTGPMGMGPMTGGGRGFCAVPISAGGRALTGRRVFGMGSRGRGGRGFRHWFYATGMPGWARTGMGIPGWGYYADPADWVPYGYPQEMSPKQEADMLRQQVKAMQEEINAMDEHISELEKMGSGEKK